MTSHEIARSAQTVAAALNAQQSTLNLLEASYHARRKILNNAASLSGTSPGSTEGGPAWGNFLTSIDDAGKNFAAMPSSQFYRSLRAIEQSLEEANNNQSLEGFRALSIGLNRLNEFTAAYDRYIDNRTRPNTFVAVSQAAEMFAVLNSILDTAHLLEGIHRKGVPPISDGEGELSIYLPSPIGLGRFGEKLVALSRLYSEFCELFEVSEAQHPLKIIKVESGSFDAVLAGHSDILGFIGFCLLTAAAWVYRNYTIEGKRTQLLREGPEMQTLFKLHDEMAKRGIKTEQLDQRIEKATVKIADNYNKLLEDEESVEVNSTAQAISPEGQKALLDGRRSLRLQDRQPSVQPELPNA